VIRALWIFLIGLLASGSFAPIAQWWLFPLALAFFILHTINQRAKVRALLSFLFALGFFAPMLHWSSSFVGALPWLLLTLMSALFYIPLALALKDKKYLGIISPPFGSRSNFSAIAFHLVDLPGGELAI